MLYEDDVVEATSQYLREKGWRTERVPVGAPGVDIVASRGSQLLHVEAKGEGSSREGTARYGKVFTGGQVLDHVAKAFYKAAATAPETIPAMALPDNRHHRVYVARLRRALEELGVVVFWVQADGGVVVDRIQLLATARKSSP